MTNEVTINNEYEFITINSEQDMFNFEQIYNNEWLRQFVISSWYTVDYIPENIRAGDITIESRAITKLPKKLTCYNLTITNTNIIEIPSTNIIKQSFRAKGIPTNLILPDGFQTVNIDLFNSQNITSLPKNMFITGFIDIESTGITEIQDNTYIGKWLFFDKYSPLGYHFTQLEEIAGYIFVNNNGYDILKNNKKEM